MNIDGVNTLACLSRIDRDENKPKKIYPLPHSEYDVPYISRKLTPPGSVHRQGPRARPDPILQTIQIDRTFPEKRQRPRQQRTPPVARGPQEARRDVRMYPVRMLFDLVPFLLVEPGRVPRPGSVDGRVPMDGGFEGFVRCGAKGTDAEFVEFVPMSHDLQLQSVSNSFGGRSMCGADGAFPFRTCPKGLNPAKAIAQIKLEMATGA